MPVSRPFDETAVARAARDKEFAQGLLVEAISVLRSEPEVAAVLIGHYIDGTASEDHLAAAMGMTGSNARAAMLNPAATSFLTFLEGLVALCAAEGIAVKLSCIAPYLQPYEEWTSAHNSIALARMDELMDAVDGSPAAAELAVLVDRVACYEREQYPARKRTIIEYLGDMLRTLRGRRPWD